MQEAFGFAKAEKPKKVNNSRDAIFGFGNAWYKVNMKRKQFKTAKIVVPVTPEYLKRVQVMAEAKITDVAEVVRHLLDRELDSFEKQQKQETAA